MTPLSVFALLFALCAIGRLLSARKLVPEGAAATLNAVALYVCLPASVLIHAPRLSFDRSLVGLVAIPWLLLLATVGVLLVAARALRLDRRTLTCLLLVAPLGNTSFLGYSLCPALAGEGALKYAVVYDQLGSFVILSTFGLGTLAMLGGEERPAATTMLRRVVTFPPFLALVFALTVMPVNPPAAVVASLSMIASALLPLVALALGMQLRLSLPRAQLLPLGLGIGLKLLVLPALAVALCTLFGLHGDARAAAILESAMPTMITAGALLAMAGIAPELAAAIVGYGTLLSAVTLPLWRLVL